jgi:hypothetical protein
MTTARNTDAADAGLAGPVELFRAGTHTDANGRRVTITREDLAAIARRYDPALHEAPVVIGHPGDDAPAYGWVERLELEGDVLVGRLAQVEPQFAELVRAGRFKKVSIALYGPEAPNNPAAGGWYLRHVGFLGAQPPAVKGLRSAHFSGTADGVFVFAESWTMSLAAGLFRRLREFLIGQFGQDAADKALPADTIAMIAEAPAAEPMREPAPASSTAFTETDTEEPAMATEDRSAEFAERERTLAAREAELARLQAEIDRREREARAADDARFLDGLVREARLPLEARPLAASLLAQLDAATTVEFGEAGKLTPHAALRALLARLPARVAFGEHAAGDGPVAADGSVSSITAAADALIKSRADAGQTITFREAVRLVEQETRA